MQCRLIQRAARGLARPAYTLVELLVCMAIILLIAGLLFVVIRGVLMLVRSLAAGDLH